MQPDATLPEEERLRTERETYPELVARLSRLSVTKHYDAYADIPWDDAQYRIDSRDPTWELDQAHPLGGTAWYREQPSEMRSRIGLHYVVCSMHTGTYFENVLTRGLFEFALLLPNTAPEFRYAYHEAIEETQHSLMFREFVNRAGLEPGDPSALVRAGGRRVVRMARRFPELFFLFVLGGEDPIDYVQRRSLRKNRDDLHPLFRRIMQIHVTEEARHMSFARHALRKRVPELTSSRRWRLGLCVPIILGVMGRMMMEASPQIAREYNIPREVVDGAYRKSPIHSARIHEASTKLFGLCDELGLINRWSLRLWRMMRILPHASALVPAH